MASQSAAPTTPTPIPARRSGGGNGFLAFVLGAMATVGMYAAVHQPQFRESQFYRYTTGHWVEYASIGMFFWALAGLWLQWLAMGRQRAALRYRWFRSLENTPGPLPATMAADLLKQVNSAPARVRSTWLGDRLADGLMQVRDSGSAEGIEDHLRYLADIEADHAQQRLAFVRVIAWMIPILGFLGTVMGITIAIANISPEQLESSLGSVTGGLAVAFDTTAVALTLSIALMMAIYTVERRQHSVLHLVEEQAGLLLNHRFLKVDRHAEPFLRIVRAMGETLFDHVRRLTERQVELWSSALGEIQHANHLSGDRVREDLSRTLHILADQHRDERAGLAETVNRLHSNQQALTHIGERLAEMSTATGRLGQMTQTLGESLRVVQDARRLEETLHSLAGAVHLLTARAERLAASDNNAATSSADKPAAKPAKTAPPPASEGDRRVA